MQEFFNNNWLSMISILIGIAVAYVFYRLQKKDSASVSAERKKHAHAELLDVVESYIINKQELSESVIDNLIHASERYHSVVLRPLCTAISLLQDVALRLQRSRHLDIPQKSEYSVKIDALIREVKARARPVMWEDLTAEGLATINEVVSMVPEVNRENVRKKLEVLGAVGALAENHGEISYKFDTTSAKLSMVSAATTGLAASLVVSDLGAKLFRGVDVSTDLLAGKTTPIFVALLLMVITSFILVTVRKRQRKSSRRKSSIV